MIIFRNIIEMATAIFVYGFIGFQLSFGKKSFYGMINYEGYIGDENANLSLATLGFSSCLLGTAITSTMLVARLRQLPMLLITVLISSAFLPILMCWCWSSQGWMTHVKLVDQRVSVKDFGANLVVHVPTATIGLIGTLFLGRRIMKLKDVDKFSLGNEYTSGIVTGYIFIIIGHIGLNMPTSSYEARHEMRDYISHVSVNSLMALGAGILVISLLVVVFTRDVYRYWIIVKCLQGGLAGVVIVSAGIDVYTPAINFGIACGGSMIFFLVSNLVHYSAVEDCCNIVAIYLVCGSLGVLLPSVLGSKEHLGLSVPFYQSLIHLLWQFLCLIIVLIMTIAIFLSVFTLLHVIGVLRNEYEEENHQRAKVLYGRLPWKRYLDRIFMINDKSKDISPESNRDAMNQTFTAT
ncbi:putative ammonium transporter 1 isoform X2 [Anthonomus grandis grandis]|uniref:putative ammonium transporter 1 isoform X2 n=1 Tax=Anthonomus grandis grandis TaxID=2921223 RepID=UPI002166AF3D|nr:putative ammonium transporter 1 isoform X2 [Anthonomus grandis grandis]